MVHSYLNGTRTLSNDRLSVLMLGHPDPSVFESPNAPSPADFSVMMCGTHFIGDGHSLHQTSNDLFTMLNSRQSGDSNAPLSDLHALLQTEWATACGFSPTSGPVWLPESSDARLPPAASKFQNAAAIVDFQSNEARLVVSQQSCR